MSNVVNLRDAIARAQRAQQARSAKASDDGSVYEAEQAELLRRERLARAKPRLPAEALQALVAGKLRQTRHLDVVQAWVERSNRPILFVAGSTGTGKSVAAAWAIAKLGGAYLSASDLVRMSRTTWREREQLEDKLGARLLVLDDLGTEPDLAAMHGPLLDLVDRRQGHPWLTIVTTNLPKETVERPDGERIVGLRDRYPEPRLWSRLTASWAYVSSTGDDLRARGEK